MSRVLVQLAKIGAMGSSPAPVTSYTPLVNNTPKPVAMPKQPAPLATSQGKIPGIGKPLGAMPAAAGAVAAAPTSGGIGGGMGGGSKTADILPWLLGGGAGVGGYAATKKYIDPLLANQEQNLQQLLRLLDSTAEKNPLNRALAILKKTRKRAPVAVGAVTALLVGTIAAKKAREDERERMQHYVEKGVTPEYSRTGYIPSQQVGYGSPEAFY
jgi:hypothetical protein